VSHLNKSYKMRRRKEHIQAVNDVSFKVQKGEILGLLGPNGAGKTTTIKMICGLLIPDSGSISIKGMDLSKNKLQGLQHISAVLEGNRNLYWRLTVRENLEYFAGNRGKSRKEVYGRIEELLEQFNLKGKEQELARRRSRGMHKDLASAGGLLADSGVISFDGPTLGIEIETGYEVRQILSDIVEKSNRTIILS